MAGSARLQRLPTTPLRGRQAWSPSHCVSIYNNPKPDKIALARFPTPNPPSGQGGLQMDKGWGPPTLHDLQMDTGRDLGSTTGKWTRVAPPPPTLHELQIDKGWGPPQLLTTWGGRAPTLHDLQMDKGWAPQPSTTCKWTRVGAPQPLTTWGGSPSRLAICKWTRVGPPNPSRLANGQGLGAPQPLTTWGGRAPQPFTTCKWTRLGPPNPSRLGAAGAPNPSGLEAAEPSTLYDLGWGATNPSPKIGKPVTGPFGPELT